MTVLLTVLLFITLNVLSGNFPVVIASNVNDFVNDEEMRFDQFKARSLLEAIGESNNELRQEVEHMLETNSFQTGDVRTQCGIGHQPRRHQVNLTTNFQSTLRSECGNCPINLTDCDNLNCGIGNGVTRLAYFTNGNLFPKAIEVCENDTLVVDVLAIFGDTLLHFYGFRQLKTPYMDGARAITQCSNTQGVPFRYEFVATDIGIHMWYMTLAFFKSDGGVGPIIVRSADDPWGFLQETDKHVIMFYEWLNQFEYIDEWNRIEPEIIPASLLINGRGADCVESISTGGCSENYTTITCKKFPLTEIYVKKGRHQRLRLINAGSFSCPIQLQIDSHEMTIIAADGSPVVPVKGVKTIVMLPGERYDVVVFPDQKVGAYWIHLKALGVCEKSKLFQRALLIYEGSASIIPRRRNPGYNGYNTGYVLNPLDEYCIGSRSRDLKTYYFRKRKGHKMLKSICSYQLEELNYFYRKRLLKRDRSPGLSKLLHDSFYANFRFTSFGSANSGYKSGNSTSPKNILSNVDIHLIFNLITYVNKDRKKKIRGFFNNISLKLPRGLMYNKVNFSKSFPKLRCLKDGSIERCLHVIQVKAGNKVDIILEHKDKKDPIPNSFHLHGYKFKLLYQGHYLEDAMDHNNFGEHPSIRDTVVVPAGGVARIRFHANNIGLWLLESNRIRAFDGGLGVILQVGDTKDFPPYPDYMPTC